MKLTKVISSLVLVLGLVGCTPPMPPEVKAALADKYVTCVDGPLTVSGLPDVLDLLTTWSESYMANCKNSSLQIVEFGNTADIVLAGKFEPTPTCTPELKLPVGLDGVVAVATLDGIENLVLSPQVLNRALLGQVSAWNDPEIAALNPEIELPDTPMQVAQSGTLSEIEAFNLWMKNVTDSGWQPLSASPDQNTDGLMESGTIGLTSLAFAQNNSLSITELLTPASEESLYAESAGVDSAGTQMVLSNSGNEYNADIDPTIPPTASEGTDEAAVPWQGVSQTTLTLCQGANELAAKAFAKFVLRLDSQGEFVAVGHNALPELIRLELLNVVSVGLPDPTIPPTDAPAENTPTDMPSEEPAVDATDAATPEPTS